MQPTASWIAALHDEATEFFTGLDRGGNFVEESWKRPGGGGGVARLMTEGETFEKAGVNRSAVDGALSPGMAERLGGAAAHAVSFFASGLSIVAHPRSPIIPTVHLNVRWFELRDRTGITVDAWYGGGTDLTPTYPHPEDARHFHTTLRMLLDGYHPDFYARFKPACDVYFANAHRGGEPRGVGGIFFDNLREGDSGLNAGELRGFVDAVGRVLPSAYAPIVERRRDEPYGERERRLQLMRRGRYVEFNLVHDRGTLFGLQTNARIESVLMSLPPLASWQPAPVPEPGSIEARLAEMLQPRDWADATAP